MSNIKRAFDHGKAFIAFITCGDPDLATTAACVREAVRGGADLIELGIPFSDPTAEGPVIQAANERAIKDGVTTDGIFQLVQELRKDVTVPMVFMTYANVVYSYGIKRFFERCVETGIDGMILPDVPYEEKEEFAPACRAHGLSFISFACEKPTVSSAAVRKAIAYCMDRDAVTADYTGSFGQRVDGFYGIGQWMVGLVNGTLDFTDGAHAETEAAIREEISLDRLIPYTVDIEKAVSLLEEDGWVLNGNGRREKDGVVLDLLLVYPEGNNIEPSLQKNLADNLEKAGIGLTMEAVPMDALLSSWYQQSERKAEAAEAMRRTDPGDVLNYLRRWVLFQERFNEVLPMLPVYSNRYYDFYTSDLQQYRIAEHITWGEAIVGAELKP